MTLDGFTDAALANLERLVASKAGLIKKTLGAEALPIERTKATLRFPWFSIDTSPEQFRHTLCSSKGSAQRQRRRKELQRSSEPLRMRNTFFAASC